jgi:CRP-like cAMP-binding protein
MSITGMQAALRSYAAGEVIVAEGDVGREMFIVAKGSVRVMKGAGHASREIAAIGAGSIFGELALVEDLKRSATVVAGDEGVEVLPVTQARFVHLIGQQPAFALFVIQALGRRIRDLDGSA